MSNPTDPQPVEVHPGWGSKIAQYDLNAVSGTNLGVWYETGDKFNAPIPGWATSHIYTSIPFGPNVDGAAVDFVMEYVSDAVDGTKTPPPTTGEKYAMRTTWEWWREGKTQLNKAPNNNNWKEVYRVSAATKKGGKWMPGPSLLAVMAVSKHGGAFTWWVPGDYGTYNESVPTSKLTVSDAETTLYFQSQAELLTVSTSDGQSWYISGDDPD